MKKSAAFLIVIMFCLLLCACSQNSSQSDPKPNTAEPMVDISDKYRVDEFFKKAENCEGGKFLMSKQFTKENCYNITPADIAKMGGNIFKFSDSCASFLLYENEIYQLGEYNGGYGLHNAVTCDFDNDGKKDILYSYSWGSGIHRSIISVFNTATKKDTVVFNSFDGKYSEIPTDIDLIVSKQNHGSETDNSPEVYSACSAKISVKYMNFAKLQYDDTKTVGTIKSDKNAPVFTSVK